MQDYQVDLYLRQHWFDPRLNHSDITQVSIIIRHYQPPYHPSHQVLDLNDPKLVQAIWKPEVRLLYLPINPQAIVVTLCRFTSPMPRRQSSSM